jgi:hypothetical protein
VPTRVALECVAQSGRERVLAVLVEQEDHREIGARRAQHLEPVGLRAGQRALVRAHDPARVVLEMDEREEALAREREPSGAVKVWRSG